MVSGRDQKEVRYDLQQIHAILPARSGLDTAQHVAQPGWHDLVWVPRKCATNARRFVNSRADRRFDCGCRLNPWIVLPVSQLFTCSPNFLLELLAYVLIVDDSLGANGLGDRADAPVSFEKLDHRELNRMNEQSKPNAGECQEGDTGDAKACQGLECMAPVRRMQPGARFNQY